MIVNEMFYSVQGEGRLAGVPSVFVRLAGCPLRCAWCDSKYAWSETAGRKYSAGEIREFIQSHDGRFLVVTGGEPMVRPGLKVWLDGVAGADEHVTIETSGIEFVDGLRCDLMSISPKLANSAPPNGPARDEHEARRFDIAALTQLIAAYDYQLKFVVDSVTDLAEIDDCLAKIPNVDRDRVYLMPQAQTRQDYLEKMAMVAELCKKEGFRLSSRLQVLMWDGQRGK